MASAKPAIHNKRRNKIRIHHEGVHTLIVCGVALAAIIALSCLFIDNRYVSAAVIVVFSVIYGIMVNFFRCPIRMFLGGTNNAVVAPADGKVVVVEEVEEVQLGHIVIVAGEEPAHRRGVGDAVPLHVGEEGLVDPVYLLLGQGTGLCRR